MPGPSRNGARDSHRRHVPSKGDVLRAVLPAHHKEAMGRSRVDLRGTLADGVEAYQTSENFGEARVEAGQAPL